MSLILQKRPLVKIIRSIFARGNTGCMIEPWNQGTLFQDSAGTTPISAVEQGIGRISDTSGSGNHLIQATAASEPMYRVGVVNTLLNSNTITSWSGVNSPSATQNLTGPNGLANYGWTVTDDSAAAVKYYVGNAGSIHTSTLSYTGQAKILKTTGAQTNYPVVQLTLTGGATQAASAVVDTTNGVLYDITGQVADSKSCVLHSSGLWWLVSVTKANAGASTAADLRIIPAARQTASTGGFDTAAVGSCGFCEGMVKLGTSHADEYVETAGTSKSNGVGAAFEQYDGIDDHFTCATGGGSSTAFSLQMAIMLEGAAAAQTIWSDAGANIGLKIERDASNQIVFSGGNGAAFVPATSAALTVGTAYVITCTYDGTTLSIQINNGTPVTAACTLSAGTAGFTVGKANGAASNYFNGRIYGIIYTKNYKMTDAEISAGKRLLAARSGAPL